MTFPPDIKALILDMDGVLWREAAPIGDLPAIFKRIRARDLKVALATNNSSKTVAQFLDKLTGFGVELKSWQIVTSSLASAQALSRNFPAGTPVFMIGQSGIRQALDDQGFVVMTDPSDERTASVVVVGIDFQVSYQKLRRAALLIRGGAAFYGTNPDRTFPTPEGLVPGAGSLLAALEAATDLQPIVIGKPSPFMMHMALERLEAKAEETLVVGDRLETDILAGQAAGCKTALVLSGVTTREQAEKWQPVPDVVAEDLSALLK